MRVYRTASLASFKAAADQMSITQSSLPALADGRISVRRPGFSVLRTAVQFRSRGTSLKRHRFTRNSHGTPKNGVDTRLSEGSNPPSSTINPLQRVSLCMRSTPFSDRETGLFLWTWLPIVGRNFPVFGPFPLSLLYPMRTCKAPSPQDHPYTNQRLAEKVRQAFLLGIGRAVWGLETT
jgi:hypothetical protein